MSLLNQTGIIDESHKCKEITLQNLEILERERLPINVDAQNHRNCSFKIYDIKISLLSK